jgi:colanic acid biosynthesis glycosyl transferase WcaI
MRILIHGMNFFPEPVGVGKYTGEMASWLAARGHEVRVVTPPPHYPQWRVSSEYRAWKYSREQHQVRGRDNHGHLSRSPLPSVATMEVFRCPIWVPRNPHGLRRLLYPASFWLSSWPAMLRQIAWRPDVTLLVEPTLLCSLEALLVARLSGAKAWLHVQDFEVDAAFELGDFSSPLVRQLAQAAERFLMRRFDRVSSISGRMVERLIAKGVNAPQCFLLTNWVDTSAIYPLPGPSPLRQEFGIPDQAIVALYSGNMGKKQGLELLAEASRHLAPCRPDIQFVFCGEGSYRDTFIRLAGDARNVMFLPVQPADRLNDLLNLADIHLLPQRANVADLVMPSKLTGMLASGRAVVASANAGSQIFTVLEGRGLLTPPGDVGAFVSAVVRLADDRDLRRQLGDEARKYAIRYLQRDEILEQFELSLLNACGYSPLAIEAELSQSRNDKRFIAADLPVIAKRAGGN